MENLISLVNRLQRAYAALGDHGEETTPPTLCDTLHSIAVVGGQSCRKASLFGSMVEKDFLPRRSGIVTRRPLLQQLQRIDKSRECAELEHLPRRRFTDVGTWKVLRSKFSMKYFSPTKEAEITQKMDGSLFNACERHRELLRKSPTHKFNEEQQVCQFYGGFISNTSSLMDRGSLMSTTDHDAMNSLENMATNSFKRSSKQTLEPTNQTSFGDMNYVDQMPSNPRNMNRSNLCCALQGGCLEERLQKLEENLNQHVATTNAKLNELVNTIKVLSSHMEMISMQVEQVSKIVLESLDPKSPCSSNSGD